MVARSFDYRLGQYQGNAYPAMLGVLADQLQVSAESLTRLGLGFAPIIQFKTGANFQGWWVIPERDAVGEPTGLGLRSESGFKAMYPGSKHGLIYGINPEHERGSIAYQPGAHNYARTAESGVLCPVCGKPDGCLVSSEDPDDPQAAICIRVPEGAKKPMRFGYLHILKPEGHLCPSSSVLPPSDYPVIVLEGMTDTATAMDMGLVGVGRPSNLACMDALSSLVRGRDIIVVGENDEINPQTGSRPGEEGMVASFQILKKVCPNIKMVMPPPHVKDFREWVTASALTLPEFLAYVAENGRAQSELTVLPDSKPLTMARAWLHSQYRMAGRTTLRVFDGQWFCYSGSKYTEVNEDTDIRGNFYQWCDDKLIQTQTQKGETRIDPVICHKGTVNNLMDALLAPCPLDVADVPAWINEVDGPDPYDLIAFTNGILRVSEYLAGASEEEYLLDSTPDFFTTFCLPFAFDPTAKCPQWETYLESTLGDAPDKIALLREWFGYCMTPDTHFHKMMLFRGPRRSGKSTALAVLQAIVGQEQCGSISFTQLTERFGLEGLVGKQLALMGDARLPRSSDSVRALELLLNIVGADPVNIDRKFRRPLANHRLKCRFTLATNELPELPDHSGALEARLNILDFKHSFLGSEDFHLQDKLCVEASGIVVWALQGLKSLREQDRFSIPESSKVSLREWRTTTSPTAAFLEECCDLTNSEAEVLKMELFDAWDQWSRERGMHPTAKSRFFERIKSNAQFVISDTYSQGGHKYSVYRGISLKPWASKQFIGKPV